MVEKKENKMNNRELIMRYLLCVIGLFMQALGVAVTRKGDLGVSPISSVGNVMSLIVDNISLGIWLIIWNCLLILGQVLILRKNFKLIQLLQIPFSILFGIFTDFCVWILSQIEIDNYIMQMFMVIAGTVLLAFGISLTVIANVIMNSGEAFVKAVSDTIHGNFGYIKVIFDVCCVVVAVILSLIFFDFTLQGTREGTVITALITGVLVNIITKYISLPIKNIIQSSSQKEHEFKMQKAID